LVAERVWHFTPVSSPKTKPDLSAENAAWMRGREVGELSPPEFMQPPSQISDDQCRHRTRYRRCAPCWRLLFRATPKATTFTLSPIHPEQTFPDSLKLATNLVSFPSLFSFAEALYMEKNRFCHLPWRNPSSANLNIGLSFSRRIARQVAS
jgi:hypothetical protein